MHFNCFDSGWSAEHLNYVTTINNCVNLRKKKKKVQHAESSIDAFLWKMLMNEKYITKQNNKVIFNLLLTQHNPETNLTSILTFDFIISSHQLDIGWWLWPHPISSDQLLLATCTIFYCNVILHSEHKLKEHENIK